MKSYLLIFLGGGIGSILRFYISKILNKLNFHFPLGTFLVNVLGCFLIGIMFSSFGKNNFSDNWKIFLTIGLCGGFTTFSTFSYENILLLKNGNYLEFIIYTLLSIIFCLLATIFGIYIFK